MRKVVIALSLFAIIVGSYLFVQQQPYSASPSDIVKEDKKEND